MYYSELFNIIKASRILDVETEGLKYDDTYLLSLGNGLGLAKESENESRIY